MPDPRALALSLTPGHLYSLSEHRKARQNKALRKRPVAVQPDILNGDHNAQPS